MGISAAMTPKERKQILKGLLEQGAVEHRQGKRGTILHLPNGGTFNVPVGTSDHKARLAMRAEVKRAGLHWPLDPPEKKEKNMPIIARNEQGEIVPPAVTAGYENGLPLRSTWEAVRPILEEYDGKEFWTDDVLPRVADMSGYRGSGGARRLQHMLWFGGFRVIDAKPNRNGFSYRWNRPEGAQWPTAFGVAPSERGFGKQDSKPEYVEQEPEAEVSAKPSPAMFAGKQGTPTPAPAAEQEEAVFREVTGADEDTELALAEEYERRALKAERDRDIAKAALEAEKRAHAETRRSLMVKNASQETVINQRDAEIVRLRSLLQERAAEIREGAADSSVLQRAHKAEQMNAALQDDVADLTRRLRGAEDNLNREVDEKRAYKEVADTWQARALRAEGKPAVGEHPESGWWPLEPQKGQTIEETMNGAKLFGLEVRVQARRRA